jgi:hypothetical protein
MGCWVVPPPVEPLEPAAPPLLVLPPPIVSTGRPSASFATA